MTKQKGKKSWLDEISIKCGYSKDLVRETIEKYNIHQSPTCGRPKHLYIQDLRFSGEKEGKFSDEFKFEFNKLTPGVWGIFSDENLRGKTTILEVIKWLLRGKSSSLFQDGVKNWISNAELYFNLDEKTFHVTVQQTEGEVSGRLSQIISEHEETLAEFFSNEDFEICMSEFMLKEFSLDNISAFRQSSIKEEVGKKVNHSWPSLASALFISTDYTSLFGDIVSDGLSGRLMNMYLGLPWIATHVALKTLEKQLNSEAVVEKIHQNKELERRNKRLLDITNELHKKEILINSMPLEKEFQHLLFEVRKNYTLISREITKLDSELRRISTEYELVKETKINDAKKINNFFEDKAANAVFKSINPTCCPHCEREISKEKIEKEKTQHKCAICDEPLLSSEDSELILNELQLNLKSSEKAFKEIDKELNTKQDQHKKLLEDLHKVQAEIERLEKRINESSERSQIEQDINRCKILIDEYSNQADDNSDSDITSGDVDELKIVKSAIDVTKDKFEELQQDLLKEVSDEILKLSAIVGLDQVQSVKLTANPALSIEKDGIKTSYSKCSEGEKLRFKVITTIALLSVAEKRKLGRHPGLLLIDSPGAQEVTDNDVNNLIEGLKKLSEELPFLQVIIASRATEVVLAQIDDEHRKYATGTDYLW